MNILQHSHELVGWKTKKMHCFVMHPISFPGIPVTLLQGEFGEVGLGGCKGCYIHVYDGDHSSLIHIGIYSVAYNKNWD